MDALIKRAGAGARSTDAVGPGLSLAHFSAEHGIGQYLVAEMRLYKSEVGLSMMRSVKRALDPRGLFNPAKVIPPV